MSWHVRVIPNRYADSVRLMAVARDVRGRDGVDACEIAIGTPANVEALTALGARADAQASDVMIAVQAGDGAAGAALDAAERALTSAGTGSGATSEAPPPRSVPAAAARLAGANVALISVPGEFGALAAHQALTCGMHAFVFSDHVPVEQEVELKRRGVERGLLVMGPECGTAMLGDTGLGFSNVVRRGPVGVVAAAGSGAQEVACLIDAAGGGVSHIIGVGGRDLSAEVGGIMFREGIRLLADDDVTETLLLVSKPPDAEVVRGLADVLPREKRVVAVFVGGQSTPDSGDEVPFAAHSTLEGGAYAAAGVEAPDWSELEQRSIEPRSTGSVLGLFSGGSLCHEAATILERAGAPHRVIDLGTPMYTQGRPHPMVDLGRRIELLAQALDDDSVGCVLIDVVLGRSAHPDPASELAPAVERFDVPVVAHVCGTRWDPQDAVRQAATLHDAGAVVAPSNAAAARLAARAVAGVAA
jgi:FdrA protein